MKASEQINELATALAKAQAEIEAAPKDKDNPFFKSKYADLSSIWQACRGPLTKNGLSVAQGNDVSGSDCVRIVTRLMHVSGQWLESTLDLLPKDASPQAVGSCITYGRRYMLAAIAGVYADEDDDGNAASGRAPNLKSLKGGEKPFVSQKDVYGGKNLSDTKIAEQKKALMAIAKAQGVTKTDDLKNVHAACIGIEMAHLPAAVSEWLELQEEQQAMVDSTFAPPKQPEK